jgi:hypothetical protein
MALYYLAIVVVDFVLEKKSSKNLRGLFLHEAPLIGTGFSLPHYQCYDQKEPHKSTRNRRTPADPSSVVVLVHVRGHRHQSHRLSPPHLHQIPLAII